MAFIFNKKIKLGELVSISWNAWMKHFGFFTLLLIPYFILMLIQLYAQTYYLSNPNLMAGLAKFLIVSLIVSLLSIIPIFLIIIGADSIIRDKKFSIKEALNRSWSVFPKSIITYLLLMLFIILLLILLIIPGIIFGVFWTFVVQALILRRKCCIKALKHSYHVVKGDWWKVLGNLIVIGLIIAGLSYAAILVVYLIAGIIALASPTITFLGFISSFLFMAIMMLITTLALPFVYIAETALFLNLEGVKKLNKE
ncbi:hypothetical protein JW756_04320 [Candidatus Woesearchaeota archaeon]|nr:hypothetical protein [Candidatus Woesearchaeota archaeon]